VAVASHTRGGLRKRGKNSKTESAGKSLLSPLPTAVIAAGGRVKKGAIYDFELEEGDLPPLDAVRSYTWYTHL
jgi:hypothetical protein